MTGATRTPGMSRGSPDADQSGGRAVPSRQWPRRVLLSAAVCLAPAVAGVERTMAENKAAPGRAATSGPDAPTAAGMDEVVDAARSRSQSIESHDALLRLGKGAAVAAAPAHSQRDPHRSGRRRGPTERCSPLHESKVHLAPDGRADVRVGVEDVGHVRVGEVVARPVGVIHQAHSGRGRIEPGTEAHAPNHLHRRLTHPGWA